MKIKKAIIYGIILWILTYFIGLIFKPLIIDGIPYINLVIPISITIITTTIGILYIRDINDNELFEGFLLGIVLFFTILICDLIYFVFFNEFNPFIEDFIFHLIFLLIFIPFITSLLGYLAQMTIELR